MRKKSVKILVILAAVLIVGAIAGSSMFVQVPTGHTGVVTTFGRVESYVLAEGINFKLPWQKVVKMDNRVQKESLNMQAFSSDIQQVDVICSVNFSVDRETSQELYRNVGAHYYTTVVEPRINEDLRSIFSKYSADSLIASREILSEEIKALLSPEMKAFGIEVMSISIENMDFTDVFTDAVEKKQVAEQSRLQAQIEQNQKTMEESAEAERNVIAAEAAAKVARIDADAKAYAVEVQAKAEAEANDLIAKSITDELITYNETNRWNGVLPQFYGADGMLPILDTRSAENASETSARSGE